MIYHKDWDINEEPTGRLHTHPVTGKKSPIIGATFKNGLNDIDPDGSFVPCDMAVEEITDGVTHLKVKRGRYGQLRFGDSGNANSFLVKIKNKGLKGVSFKYTGAVGSSMTSNNGKPLCNFDNGISIESTPTYNGVKMDIIVNDPLTAPLEYPFSVKDYRQKYTFIEENGGATLRGEDQDPIFIKPPFAVDANGDIGAVTIHYTGMVNNLITFKKVVDEVWLRQAAAPVRIDPDVTLSGASSIDDTYIDANVVDNNYGASAGLLFGDSARYRTLIGVDLSAYAGVTPLSGKFTLNKVGGGNLANVYFYRVLRDWGEGTASGSTSGVGQSSWNDYAKPAAWTTAGCDGAGTDREAVAQSASPLSISFTNELKDFVCDPASIELDLGSRFSILILDDVTTSFARFDSTDAGLVLPTFFMEYIAGDAWHPFFFDGGHY